MLGTIGIVVFVGLILVASNHEKPWTMFLWFPIAVTSTILTLALGLSILAAMGERGWGGLKIMLYLFPFLGSAFVSGICVFLRPPSSSLRASILVPSIVGYVAVCIAVFASVKTSSSVNLTVYVKDSTGKPLQNVSVEYQVYSRRDNVLLQNEHSAMTTDSDGKIQLSVIPVHSFCALVHEDHSGCAGSLYLNAPDYGTNGVFVVRHNWTTMFADARIKNEIEQEVPYGYPLELTLYTVSSHASPINPLLQELDKQFAVSPADAIRTITASGNFIALRHRNVIKSELLRSNIQHPQIPTGGVWMFLESLERGYKHLAWRSKDGSWKLNDTEALHALYAFLDQEETEGQTPAEKLKSLGETLQKTHREVNELRELARTAR